MENHTRYFKLIEQKNEKLYLNAETQEILQHWLQHLKQEKVEDNPPLTMFIISGKDEYSLEETSAYISNYLNKTLFAIKLNNLKKLYSGSEEPIEEIKNLMSGFIAVNVTELEDSKVKSALNDFKFVLDELFSISPILFVLTQNKLSHFFNVNNFHIVEINLDLPDEENQASIWQDALATNKKYINDDIFTQKVKHYKFYEGQIRQIIDLTINTLIR